MPPRVLRSSRRTGDGFTLVELAVVVFVVALILGGILVPLSSQVEQRQIADTQRLLEAAREALVGYSVTNGCLPCPDKLTSGGPGAAPNDGLEDFDNNTGVCAVAEGNLPWATLGMAAVDAWGNRIRYRVTPAYAVHPGGTGTIFGLDTQGSVEVCEVNDCSKRLTVTPPNLNSAAAVLVSHGPNGLGAINGDTGALRPAPTGPDELENADGANAKFISRVQSASTHPDGEFDDLVVWLSPHTLKHRMVSAGKLP